MSTSRLLSSIGSAPGIYILLLSVKKPVAVNVGALGNQLFPAGIYAYTGSALGRGAADLRHRISRHLKRNKQKFWHIDYLLADTNVSIAAVVAAETEHQIECTANRCIKTVMDPQIPVKGFGASDCKKNCRSHLLHFPEAKNVEALAEKMHELLKKFLEVHAAYPLRY